jgi:hypothetical protein
MVYGRVIQTESGENWVMVYRENETPITDGSVTAEVERGVAAVAKR